MKKNAGLEVLVLLVRWIH